MIGLGDLTVHRWSGEEGCGLYGKTESSQDGLVQ